jgi:hypothetical protein
MINTVQKYIFFLRLASFIAILTINFAINFVIKIRTRKYLIIVNVQILIKIYNGKRRETYAAIKLCFAVF